MALGLGALQAWLAGARDGSRLRMFKPTGGKDERTATSVRTAMIEMGIDRDAGKIWGTVLAGPNRGKSLDVMTGLECRAFYSLCLRDDLDGARLMEAYLDHRFAGWRFPNADERDPTSQSANQRLATMSEDEAYGALGLRWGASDDEIARSHRSLMKKLHPDVGGSTDLAARLNQAKDVLKRRHR